MRSMRTSCVLLALSCALGCGRQGRDQNVSPGPLVFGSADIVLLRLDHGIGGWGNGANYFFEVSVEGTARYEGGLRATFTGGYTSRLDPSTVLSVFRQATQLESSLMRCTDVPTVTITVTLRNGTAWPYPAECGAPDRNRTFANKLDSLFAAITWAPIQRAP